MSEGYRCYMDVSIFLVRSRNFHSHHFIVENVFIKPRALTPSCPMYLWIPCFWLCKEYWSTFYLDVQENASSFLWSSQSTTSWPLSVCFYHHNIFQVYSFSQTESSFNPFCPGLHEVNNPFEWLIFDWNSSLISFLILFVLFFVALEFSERSRLNAAELCFMIFALGFALEKVAAMQEHGIKGTLFCVITWKWHSFRKVYFKGTWVRLLILSLKFHLA